MHEPVSIAWRERPFDGHFHHKEMPAGSTIVEIIEPFRDLLPRGFFDGVGEARLNGDLIPRELWARVKPKAGTSLTLYIQFRDPGGGAGGSGGGGTAALVATIAVLLVAAAVSGGALLPAAFAAIPGASAIAGAGIGIGGALLISALFKPPSLSVANSQQKAPVAGNLPASLQGNVLSPGAAVPRVIGTMRLFPPFLTPPLIEIIGKIEYAEAVFGLAGPHSITAIQSDGVDITTEANVDIEVNDARLLGYRQTLVSRYGYTDALNTELSKHVLQAGSTSICDPSISPDLFVPQWHQVVTRNSPDEVWITLSFPEGLSNQSTDSANVAFRIQFRQHGTSTLINFPEVHIMRTATIPGGFEKDIRIKWGAMPVAPNTPVTGDCFLYAFKHVPAQDASLGVTDAAFDADSSFSLGAGNDVLSAATFGTSNVTNVELFAEKVIFYLDPNVFPQGVYDIQVKRGFAYLNKNLTASNYHYVTGVVTNFFIYAISGGNSQLSAVQDNVLDKSIMLRVASVVNQNPIQSDDFTTISVRVHKRQLGRLSVLASGYVPDWDGSGWNTITTTSNPAPHLRDVLGGILGGSPLPAQLIDDAGLVAWRSACTSLAYECNAVLEGKTYVDALNLIAACGYATLRASETWGVVRDKDRSADTPVQIFTPRNMTNFVWTKAFTRQPTGFRVAYINADLNYTQDEEIVFADEVNQDATYLESISYDGKVTKPEVIERALHDLGQGQSRLTFYSGDCDLDALVCQRGDLAGVQHDVLAAKAGFARIKSVQTSGGNVTGLTFEGTTTVDTESGIFPAPHLFIAPDLFNLGSRTGLAIRLFGGAGILVKEITTASNGEVQAVTFVIPFTDPGRAQLDADCLCAIGPLGSEARRLLVYDISPKPADFTATVTFIDEAPELWA